MGVFNNTIWFVCVVQRDNSKGERGNASLLCRKRGANLSTEAVEGAALALESVDNIESGDSLAAGVLSVGHSITNNVLKEHLEDTSGLFVDEARDTLDTTTASETADSGLGDALDVVTQHLAMTLSATLAEAFATFATSRHG